jgi:hypothetical protein
MRPPAEDAGRSSIAARVLGLIVVAAVPALALLPSDLRPAVLRVALAAGIATALAHVIGRLVEAARTEAGGGFARALQPDRTPVRIDSSLARLGDEIRHSRRDRRYFEKILWPRLAALGEARGVPAGELPKPESPTRLGHRGPTLEALTRVVDRLEKQR